MATPSYLLRKLRLRAESKNTGRSDLQPEKYIELCRHHERINHILFASFALFIYSTVPTDSPTYLPPHLTRRWKTIMGMTLEEPGNRIQLGGKANSTNYFGSGIENGEEAIAQLCH